MDLVFKSAGVWSSSPSLGASVPKRRETGSVLDTAAWTLNRSPSTSTITVASGYNVVFPWAHRIVTAASSLTASSGTRSLCTTTDLVQPVSRTMSWTGFPSTEPAWHTSWFWWSACPLLQSIAELGHCHEVCPFLPQWKHFVFGNFGGPFPDWPLFTLG